MVLNSSVFVTVFVSVSVTVTVFVKVLVASIVFVTVFVDVSVTVFVTPFPYVVYVFSKTLTIFTVSSSLYVLYSPDDWINFE